MKNLLIITFLILTTNVFATIKTSLGGNWNQILAWSPNGVPVCGDTIIIPFGITVYIPANVDLNNPSNPLCASTYIDISGKVSFSNGRKIRLAAGACINISSGGEIHPSKKGGGKSESIQINKVYWWVASDGPLINDQLVDIRFGCEIPLPIELISYNIQTMDMSVVIEFTMASEKDGDYYEIETSKYGSYWSHIKTLKKNTSSKYSYRDDDPMNGVSYYKLKHNNVNGLSSDMVTIPIKFYSIDYKIYPIPVDKSMVLDGPYLKDVKISFVNNIGDRIDVVQSTVSGKYVFNFESVKNGVYFIEIESENTKNIERIVVVHK